jgi:hypothetical protein
VVSPRLSPTDLSPAPMATFPEAPVFLPDGRISRVRLAALACPHGAFSQQPKLKRWRAYAPGWCGLLRGSTRFPPGTRMAGSVPGPVEGASPPSAESPFAPPGRYPSGEDLQDPLGGRYPSFFAPRAHAPGQIPLAHFRFPLVRRVFAGCRQSLLRDGPSRRYLCDPCTGARTPYPAKPFRCSYPFLLGRRRPPPRGQGIGASNHPCNSFRRAGNFGAAVIL